MKRLLVYGAGAIILAAALAALFAPALVDTPAVRAEIQRRLSAALQGQVAWQTLEVALFPAPRGELRRVRVEIPGKLGASADEVTVSLRLWPLLRGRPEVSSVILQKPQIRIHAGGGGDAQLDAVTLYRAGVEPAVRALRRFAPDMTLRIDDAAVDLAGFGLTGVSASARTGASGVDLELSAASRLWKRLAIAGRVEYADLAARARVELDDVAFDKDLPAATLRADLRTDAKSAVEAAFDARLGALAAAKGKLLLPAGKPPQLAAHLDAVDLAQAIAIARRKVGGLDVLESAEGRVSANASVHLGDAWQVQLDILKSSAAVKLARLPWKLAPHAGRVTVTPHRVHIAGARGSLGDSSFEHVAARIDLGKAARLSAASGNARLALAQWFPWLQGELLLDDVTALSGSVDVALRRMTLPFDRPAALDYEGAATLRQVSVTLKALPGPLRIASGSMRFGRERARYEKLAIALLDARALLSGTAEIKGPRIEFALEQGELGEKAVQWALGRAQVPPRFEPKTPLRFAASRVAWAPDAGLEFDGAVDFDAGPRVAAALAWRPGRLELRRVHVKDAHSDAVLGATVADDLIHANFAGTFDGRSIDGMLRQRSPADSGTAKGELRVTIDRAQPSRTAAEGHLRIEALDLGWLAGKKAVVERAEVSSDGAGLRVSGARFSWEDQLFELNGSGRRTEQGPVIDARLESPGVVLERLLPPVAEKKEEKAALWPLPVSGRIEVRSAFVQGPRHRVAPFDGILTLEPRRARLEVKAARTCGISFPMEVDATPQNVVVSARVAMKDEPLEAAMRCLTGDTVELTGSADLHAELSTKGPAADLVRNLTGTARAELRKGEVKRFALIGNILSFRDLASVSKMKEEGFPYRSMTAKGKFEGGEFRVDEAFFDSDAVRLAASGRVDLLGADTRLNVLVGLLARVDRFAEAVPIIGDIFGGSMTALPISVTGDIRDPRVVPLGPRAVTEDLLGIFERTLKLPGKLLVKPPP